MTGRPAFTSIPCDPYAIPRLRVGRKVPNHVYLQHGPEPSDADEPLFTTEPHLARMLVDGMEALRYLNLHPKQPAAER